MNKSRIPFSIEEGKIQAAILLKSLKTVNAEQSKKAAKRFQRLPEFGNFSIAHLLQQKIQLKHALAVIAIENGFYSWADAKIQLKFVIGGFLNQWFANYAEAKAHQKLAGGFLLPYKKQFFICEANYIKQLGFDPSDSNWKLIDWDWAKPQDQLAYQRLYKQWIAIQKGKQHGNCNIKLF